MILTRFVAIIASGMMTTFALTTTNKNNNSNNNSDRLKGVSHFQVKIASSITKGERRRDERKAKARHVCNGCNRPPVTCICEALPPNKLVTETTILILQHPNEFRKKSLSTTPLLTLVLDKVHVKRDYKFDSILDVPIVKEFVDRGIRPLLLFPGEDAISLDGDDDNNNNDGTNSSSVVMSGGDGDVTDTTKMSSYDDSIKRISDNNNNNLLIVLDGTWAEAKRMANASPSLFDVCQQVQFTAQASCVYDTIRKEPEGHCLSTLEACAQALVLLEGAIDVAEYLQRVLKLMVDIQVEMERTRHQDDPRQKGKQLYERNRRRRQVEKTLFYKPKPKTLPCGSILRPLTVDDAQHINESYYHQSKTSLRTIQQRLVSNNDDGLACFGIEREESPGNLFAYIVRSQDGTLSMLHVQEQYRRRGYGRILVEEATNVLQKLDKPCVCFINEGDVASEGLFSSLGWTTTTSSVNTHTKRKWILKQD